MERCSCELALLFAEFLCSLRRAPQLPLYLPGETHHTISPKHMQYKALEIWYMNGVVL